jgi:PAS domain S-box-containing protein
MLLKARMGKPIPYFEYELRRKDGTIVPVETGGQAIFEDGKPVAIQIITREVTERRKTEEALRQSEEKHRDLFENAMDVILTLDLKGSITTVNNSVLRFGYKKEDLVGKNILDFVSKQYWPAVIRDFSKVARGEPAKNETELVVPAGKILVEYNAGAIVKENNVAGVQINIRDVTERKKAEEERRETMEKVQMMNEKLRVVGGLTRHDVNNKLAAVTGNVYLARKKLPMNSEVLDYLKQIEASVEQTARIFDFAKAYEMLGVEELAYVDVEKTVDEAVSLFPSLKDVKVMNDCHGLTVLADSLLRQLFYNLIDNSLKHGEKPSRIRVFYEEKKDHLNVIYEDDGVGISQAAKPKLFDEGFTTGKGSGHGLYLVKKMMEVYGWTIQETGMPGKGAKFTIIIPRTNQNGKENYRLH